MASCPKIVVVVEDEFLIRELAVDVLTEAGFRVIEACHAEQALSILERQAEGVCVLFTDIDMPGHMDGLQLAHHAHHHWPWICLLVASGLAAPTKGDLPPGSRFLPKPYDPVHAIKHIQELVGSR
jgi:CheY-like chemotaxis protein